MSPTDTLRVRNISIVLAILVAIPPIVFLISAIQPELFAPAGSYALYAFLLYSVVALVGSIGGRLRARKHVPTELTPGQEQFAAFASIRQHLVLATNVALIILPFAGFIVGRVLDANTGDNGPMFFSGSAIIFLVLILPLFLYATVGAVASLFWILPTGVSAAEQYTIVNRLPGRRRILTTRTINLVLLILGFLGTGFLAVWVLAAYFKRVALRQAVPVNHMPALPASHPSAHKNA